MYLLFLFRRAHSRRRVERMYWSGVSLNSFTACSNEVTTGITGPIGSGFPQFGFPRLLAIVMSSYLWIEKCVLKLKCWIPDCSLRFQFGTNYSRDRLLQRALQTTAKTLYHKASFSIAQFKSSHFQWKTEQFLRRMSPSTVLTATTQYGLWCTDQQLRLNPPLHLTLTSSTLSPSVAMSQYTRSYFLRRRPRPRRTKLSSLPSRTCLRLETFPASAASGTPPAS